ncbi:putative glucose transporter [Kockovaella imperatae]|uniref:Putative glucose transporter n=1 Tax=Kockovaella imperatae TaxID=4999 RepID=A0A1Y1UNC2_9TREE|nr:putative glucose transporter [Kockovaella imperatae]ORX39558.1 putative glucose transporter [Kockovaella imperatae]
MPGGAVVMHATSNPDRVEAPITAKAYFLCVFASFGGIFFGYDTGWMGGVLAMPYFIELHTGLKPGDANFEIPAWKQSLMTSILSAGTFFGALMAGDFADYFGRRITIISGCAVFSLGCVLQTASSSGLGLFVAGRLVAGFGVGFISAIIILYLSEIAPRKVRGAIVSGYQFCITIGILLANCVVYSSKDRMDTGSYRIPIGVQFLWAIILASGLFFLPESPRWYVKRGRVDAAARSLSIVRGQPTDSDFVQDELAEIIANHEYETELIPQGNYFESWFACFRGSVFNPQSNLRRTILGTSMQMMQQWTGVNFIFYFGTVFFTSLGTISNPFLISLITTLVNVCSTPISFWTIERFGRRAILFWGAIGMAVCEFICAISGTVSQSDSVVKAQIAFICIYISFFASTWGPGAWVVVGEIFPIPIRARGVALSASSNWLWNTIITVITPYLVSPTKGDLKSKVFFLWGSLCCCCIVYTYLFVWETKGLTLEQVDRMMEECGSPRRSAGWTPHATFASEMGLTADGAHLPIKVGSAVAPDEKAHIAAGTKHVGQAATQEEV